MVFADVDMVSDLLMQHPVNREAMELSLNWLGGQDPVPSLPNTEEDVRIQHAKGDDWLWFYLPVLGVPALTLLAGSWSTLRRRKTGEASHA